MYKFSKRSLRNLEGVHPLLVNVVHRALELSNIDFTVVEGLRTIEKQREYVAKGASKTMNSYHLKQKDGYGHAVDIYPYYNGSVQVDAPLSEFKKIANAMMKAGDEYNVTITWGADWDRDGNIKEHSFIDSPHYQIEI